MDGVIPLARPWLGQEELEACKRVLSSCRLSGGPEIVRFEEKLAHECNRKHGITTSNGTTALELAFQALDLRANDRVLVTAFGFPSAANALKKQGVIPVPVDVDGATWCTDFSRARELATGAKGLVSIDPLGLTTSKNALGAFSKETGLWAISDAACSLGGTCVDGGKSGQSGILATLSFHPRKNITTGEGGAVVTDDASLADRIRRIRNHGQSQPGVLSEFSTNARLASMAAAIGSVQLQRLQESIDTKNLIAKGYEERLERLIAKEKIILQKTPHGAKHTYQSYALRLGDGIQRKNVVGSLKEKGIEAGASTYAFTEIELHDCQGSAPMAKRLHYSSLSLPMYAGMRSNQLDAVVTALEEVLK